MDEFTCNACGTRSRGSTASTLSPGVVLGYCPGCRRRMPSTLVAANVEVALPTRSPDPVPAEVAEALDEDRVQRAYREWRATPDGLAVVAAIRRRAVELRRRGWSRYGIQALAEVVRFDRALSIGPDAEGYKVNNSHLSRLARDLMDEDPDLRGFFETRELRT